MTVVNNVYGDRRALQQEVINICPNTDVTFTGKQLRVFPGDHKVAIKKWLWYNGL